MGVRIANVTPDCCGQACLNRPEGAWDRAVSGGSIYPIGGANSLELNVGSLGTAFITDSKTKQDPAKNFCFSASGVMKSGLNTGAAVIGLTDGNGLVSTHFIDISIGTGGWLILWSNGGSSTSKSLTAGAGGAVQHTVKVCRVGSNINVNINGTLFTFPVDNNFPTVTLFPTAGLDGVTAAAIFDVSNYCLS